MKKLGLAAAVMISLTFAASAQEQTWILEQYDGGVTEARTKMAQKFQSGYVPVGIEVAEDLGASVLYVPKKYATAFGFSPSEVRIETVSEFTKIKDQLNARFAQGWFPVDIARTTKAMYVVLAKTGWQVDDWGLTDDAYTPEHMKNTVSDFQKKGYAPCGTAIYGAGRIIYLFAKSPDRDPSKLYFTSYDNSRQGIVNGFNSDLSKGWFPWGFAIAPNSLLVQYER